MERDFDDSALLGLRSYVRLVSHALGLHGECSYVQAEEPLSAYVALDGRLSRFPDRDVALLWDEHHGWSAAIETHSGEDLVTVAYLGENLLPAPETVAAWTRKLFRPDGDAGYREEPRVLAGSNDVRRTLAAYVGPAIAGSAHRARGSDGESLAMA